MSRPIYKELKKGKRKKKENPLSSFLHTVTDLSVSTIHSSIQVAEGYSGKKCNRGCVCVGGGNFKINSLGWRFNVVFCSLVVPFQLI